MSSFLTKTHLKAILGQDSQIEKAWTSYYGAEILANGMLALPFAIEQFYPHVGANEWEMAVIYMIIRGSDQITGPVVSIEPQFFAEHFRLSLRQIRRKFKAMVEKGLIIITPCYDGNGKMMASRSYDINPFLNKIHAFLCDNEEWRRQQSALSNATPSADTSFDDFDDLDMLATYEETSMSSDANTNIETSVSSNRDLRIETSMSPDINLNIMTSMSSASQPDTGTSMSSASQPDTGTSLSSAPQPDTGTSLSSHADTNPRTSMSSHAHTTPRTSMSPDQSTSYAHAHTYVHTPDSNSSSNSNINTCINILNILSSNSNSNSNRATLQIFDAEEENDTWLPATHPDKLQVSEDVRTFSEDDAFEQSSQQVGKAGEQTVAGPATLPTMLPPRSRETLSLISNDLHDAQTDSSRGRARILYNQLLTINQSEDMYVTSDPDQSFSEMMLAVKHHISNQTFRNRNLYGQPNGMPLFFHELRKRVEEQIMIVASAQAPARSVHHCPF